LKEEKAQEAKERRNPSAEANGEERRRSARFLRKWKKLNRDLAFSKLAAGREKRHRDHPRTAQLPAHQ
jgi:hypothetical protein